MEFINITFVERDLINFLKGTFLRNNFITTQFHNLFHFTQLQSVFIYLEE